jgi:RHS repeat-associated protein
MKPIQIIEPKFHCRTFDRARSFALILATALALILGCLDGRAQADGTIEVYNLGQALINYAEVVCRDADGTEFEQEAESVLFQPGTIFIDPSLEWSNNIGTWLDVSPRTQWQFIYGTTNSSSIRIVTTPQTFTYSGQTLFYYVYPPGGDPIDDDSDMLQPYDQSCCGGMPVWRVSEPNISLWLDDEPLGYQPAFGQRISFKLSYDQRESSAGMNPFIFSCGRRWNFSWLTYVEFDWQGSNVVHFPGGGRRAFYGTNDYLTNTRLIGDMTNGYTLSYPDGRQDIYGCIVTNSTGAPVRAFRTASWSPQSQVTTFTNQVTYSSGLPPTVHLTSVVDATGGVTSIFYNTSNAYSDCLIAEVSDPYGRHVSLSYDTNGCLTNMVDVNGISSSFAYDPNTNFWVTQMTTPYGPTTFAITDSNPVLTNIPPAGRSVLVTEPDGASQLYLCPTNATGVPSSGTAPSTGVLANSFDNGDLNVRDSFHWGKLQYAALHNTNISLFNTNDFLKARMRHWLVGSSTMVGETLAMEQDPSPDSAGDIPGQQTWYDYAGKTNNSYEGTQILPLIVGRVLPDGTSSFAWTARNNYGAVTTNISTYSVGSTVALRGTTNTYSTNGIDLISTTNALGIQTISNIFNSYHEVTTNFNALGEIFLYTYETNQRAITITRPSGWVTTYTYGTNGFLATQIDVGIATNSYTYYSNGLVFTHTDPRNLTVTNTWDNLQRLTGTIYPDGVVSNIYLNLDLVETIDRLGFTNGFAFDSVRRLTNASDALGHHTIYSYCTCGSLLSVTDPLGNATYFSYDNQGHATNIAYPDSSSITKYYDLAGRVTNVVDGAGHSVGNYFNNQNLQIASSNAFGLVFLKQFDILDRLTNGIDQNGVPIASTYDNLNRLTSRTYADGGVEHFAYTANIVGPTSYTNQLTNATVYTYDVAGRKTTETNALLQGTEYAYDGANDLISLTDGNNHTTQWGYDVYGNVTSKTNVGTQVLTYQYDADNRLTNRWSLARTNTAYAYDNVGNLTNVIYPSDTPSLYFIYDADNRMISMGDAFGWTTNTYTQIGQLASETGPWPSDAVTFTYSNQLRTKLDLQQLSAADWIQSYGYDAANRLTNITSPGGTFIYTYNTGLNGYVTASALATNVLLPTGAYISSSADGNGRMTASALYNTTNGTIDYTDYSYNQASQRTNQVRGVGTNNQAAYTYDPIGQILTDLASEVGSGTPRLNEQLKYAYDSAGNLTNRNNNALGQNFQVNSLNELTNNTNGGTLTVMGTTTSPATNVTVNGTNASVYGDATFAATNMPLTTTYTAIAHDAYGRGSTNTVSVSLSTNVTFQYDGNGNLLSDGLRSFTYNDENQLIQVLVTNQWLSQFGYDGKMRRRTRLEFIWTNSTWIETNAVLYIYDGNVVIQERSQVFLSIDEPSATYTRGNDLSGTLQGAGGISGLLARSDGMTGQTAFYYADGNGNVRSMINSSNAIVAKYLYDAYGNILSKAGSLANANLYRFSSKEFHQPSGLVYYLYRYYDPNLQRWPNRDPMAESGFRVLEFSIPISIKDIDSDPMAGQMLNLYLMVGNDPINETDPYGNLNLRKWICGVFAAGGAVGCTIIGVNSYYSYTSTLDSSLSYKREVAILDSKYGDPSNWPPWATDMMDHWRQNVLFQIGQTTKEAGKIGGTSTSGPVDNPVR